MTYDVTPLYDRVLLRSPKVSLKSEFGVFKGQKALEEEKKTAWNSPKEVIAIGPKVDTLKIGDMVYLNPGTTIVALPTTEDEYAYEETIVSQHQIMCIITPRPQNENLN
jgi:co-chaperonin GroES (HSP10)